MNGIRASLRTVDPDMSMEWSRPRPGHSGPAGRLHLSFGRSVLGVAIVAATLLAWWLLATPQFGGGTSYIVTSGNSMEPLFHRGDLAVVRAAKRYGKGEIVLYTSPSLRRPVLHRIIVVDASGYYFKGDHNDFVDPGPVPESALVGRLWLHVPKVGMAMSWASSPRHAALIASALTLFALLGGRGHQALGAPARRRNRRLQP
jgi:signal peptidase I